ncbi:MAG: D-inositol 3-phosphate glycosyltransferase [bacterium ADurb.Bin429]|nr:MAG: D-inositol 3-phosphate glycosyltransferase [bacterium ADurb.Bin429]
MPIRVLYFHHGSARAGAPLSLLYLLRELQKHDIEATVCSTAEDTEVLRLFGDAGFATTSCRLLPFAHTTGGTYAWYSPRDLYRFSQWTADFRAARQRLAALLTAHRPDLVHFNSLVLAPYARVPRSLGIPSVVHVRESVCDGTFGLRKRWLHAQLHQASRVIFICRDNADRLPIDAAHGSVIYNPVDFTKFDYRLERSAARDALGLPLDARIVLFAGGSVPWIKGALEYLEAIGRLAERYPNILGLMPWFPLPDPRGETNPLRKVRSLISSCRYHARMARRLIAQYHLTPRLHLFPFRQDIEQFLAASDLVCVPHREPHFSRTIIEAAAMRRPVVATRIGGIAEVVEDGVTGLLTPIGDPIALAEAMARVLDDPALAATLSQQSYDYVRHDFDAIHSAASVAAVYQQLLPMKTVGCGAP